MEGAEGKWPWGFKPRWPAGQNEGNRTNQEVQGRTRTEKQDEQCGLDVLSLRGQQATKGKMSRSQLEMEVWSFGGRSGLSPLPSSPLWCLHKGWISSFCPSRSYSTLPRPALCSQSCPISMESTGSFGLWIQPGEQQARDWRVKGKWPQLWAGGSPCVAALSQFWKQRLPLFLLT